MNKSNCILLLLLLNFSYFGLLSREFWIIFKYRSYSVRWVMVRSVLSALWTDINWLDSHLLSGVGFYFFYFLFLIMKENYYIAAVAKNSGSRSENIIIGIFTFFYIFWTEKNYYYFVFFVIFFKLCYFFYSDWTKQKRKLVILYF